MKKMEEKLEKVNDYYQRPFLIHVENQMTALVDNGSKINQYHNLRRDEDKGAQSDDRSSLGAITSADEEECQILFNKQHRYRFQAEEMIKQKNIETAERETTQ